MKGVEEVTNCGKTLAKDFSFFVKYTSLEKKDLIRYTLCFINMYSNNKVINNLKQLQWVEFN